MTDETYNEIRQRDKVLRDAIRLEENSRPPMPKDLNTRLMQRVEKEVGSKPKRTVRLWPWIVAACVAGVMVVFLTPPKDNATVSEGESIASVCIDTVKRQIESITGDKPETHIASNETKTKTKTKTVTNTKTKTKTKTETETKTKTGTKQVAMAQKSAVTASSQANKKESIATSTAHTAHDMAATNRPAVNSQSRVLTERDIPVTRPENLKYTKEELALMKQQANEAYIKWVELELEIAKYNQEQTALNR
ncbi:MAG: hypothetical protein II844_00865 [Prevotella sp.]|nr:hypothetical protein [Prevotella sp.]